MWLVIALGLLAAGALCAFAGIGLLRAERRFGPEPNRGLVGRAFVVFGGLFASMGMVLGIVVLLI